MAQQQTPQRRKADGRHAHQEGGSSKRARHHASSSSAAAASGAPSALSAHESLKKLTNVDGWLVDCLVRLYVQPLAASRPRVAELSCASSSLVSRLTFDLVADVTATAAAAGGSAATLSVPVLEGNPFNIGHYVGVDTDYSGPRGKWLLRDAPFTADWITADMTQTDLFAPPSTNPAAKAADSVADSAAPVSYPGSDAKITPASFDVVFCCKTLSHRTCASEAALARMLRNAAALLKDGGVFVGTLFDPAAVWYRINKRVRESGGRTVKPEPGEGVVYNGGNCFRLDFPSMPRSLPSSAFDEPHSPALRFWLQLTEPNGHVNPSSSVPAIPASLLQASVLERAARDAGLEMLSLVNFVDFHAEHSSVAPLADTARRMKIYTDALKATGTWTQQQNDLYSLFAVFAFRKSKQTTATA
jgi:SAM-dependent methyltransferase